MMTNISSGKNLKKMAIAVALFSSLSLGAFAWNGGMKAVFGAGEVEGRKEISLKIENSIKTAVAKEATASKNPETAAKTNPTPTPGAPEVAPTQNIRFALYDVGILPRETKVKIGGEESLTFNVNNFSGLGGEVQILKETEDNTVTLVGKIEKPEGRQRVRQVIKLAPGKYWLVMTENPDNKALLVVTGNGDGANQ